MIDETQLITLRIGLLAGFITLFVVVPDRASGSRLRDALIVLALTASYLSFCLLLLELVVDVSLYAVPVSAVAIAALLFLVIEPKITTRLLTIFPDRRTVARVVRTLGSIGALVVFSFVMMQLPIGIFAAVTLASGLMFLGGLFAALRRAGAPASRRQQLKRLGGIALLALGMTMAFGGSFGVALLFDPYDTGTRGVIRDVLFGPVYALGLPVSLLGLWLLGAIRRRD
jgi:hypothetical protein